MIEMKNLEIVTAGDILKYEFLDELDITPYKLAKSIKVSATLIGKIIKGTAGITADMALRFSKFFGTTPEYWINLQASQDLKIAKVKQKEQGLEIKNFNFKLPNTDKTLCSAGM